MAALADLRTEGESKKTPLEGEMLQWFTNMKIQKKLIVSSLVI